MGHAKSYKLVKNIDHFPIKERNQRYYDDGVISRAINPKALFNSAILVLAAMFGHAVACGTFIAPVPLFLTTLGIVFIVSLLSSTELNGFLLATLVISCQMCAHFLLGSSPAAMTGMSGMGGMSTSAMGTMPMNSSHSMNSAGMISAHLIAGALSFIFIRKNETFWGAVKLFLLTVLIPIFRPAFSVAKHFCRQAKSDLTELITLLMSYLTEAASRLCAPPVLVANI
jgi:hypothetical protein